MNMYKFFDNIHIIYQKIKQNLEICQRIYKK